MWWGSNPGSDRVPDALPRAWYELDSPVADLRWRRRRVRQPDSSGAARTLNERAARLTPSPALTELPHSLEEVIK